MAYTSQQIEVLEEAIATGALTVKYADKWITYRSLSEMKSILDTMKQEVGGYSSPVRRKFVGYSSGINNCG